MATSFAHPYSFQPVTDFLSRDDACLTSSISLGGVEDTWVRYWDESSTVAVLEFKVDAPVQPIALVKEKKEKKKAKGIVHFQSLEGLGLSRDQVNLMRNLQELCQPPRFYLFPTSQ